MTGEATWWRADGGYHDVSAGEQQQTQLSTALVEPNMRFVSGYVPGYMPSYGSGFAPWMMPQTGFMEGPIGIGGICSPPPPPYAPLAMACTPVCGPPPVPEDEKRHKGEKKSSNPWAPPKLPKGSNYMFDSEHTVLHIFKKAAPIWKEKYRTQELKFKIFKVGVNFTVRMVIENVLKKETTEDCKGWAATEVVEKGDGVFAKGTTVEHDCDRSDGTLRSMGWSKKRGDALPPVWLVVHKVGFR